MNSRLLCAYFRLYRAQAALWTILILFAVCVVSLLQEEWLSALVAGVLLAAVTAFHFRTFALTAKIGAAFRAYDQGQLIQAEACLREAMPLSEQLAPNDPVRGIVYLDLANVSRLLGNYDQAEAFGQKALDVYEAAWGHDHRETVSVVLAMGQIYTDIARYPQAKPLLDRALTSCETGAASDPLDLAQCLCEHGRWWSEQGHFDRAESFFRRAFEILQKHPELTHAEGHLIRLNYASICAKLNRLDEAHTHLQAVLKIDGASGSAETLLTALCLDELAVVRLLQGHAAEAEEFQRRALAMTERVAGPNTPALCVGLTNLAGILKFQQKWREAEDCYRTALRLREEYMAPEHPILANLLEEYADLLTTIGRHDEARQCEARVQQIRQFHSPLRIV